MKKTITALLTMCALLGLTPPALAHNVLISSDPAEGASLDAGPARVTLSFDQGITAGEVNQIVVTGPGGTRWTRGPVEVDRAVATAEVEPLGPAGKYTIGYRILSADGHPVSGEIHFTLSRAGTGNPVQPSGPPNTPAPAADGEGSESSGLPLWAWILGAVSLVAAGLVLALRLGREGT